MNYMEMLAKLGVGSAHPGGFAATVEQLERFPLPEGSRVLEVGCGTGRTACLLAERGMRVTAVDIREDMLKKARIRAGQVGVTVDFRKGDACRLPFADGAFDVVMAESVSIFVDTSAALREYARVLADGGRLYDREIIALRPLEETVRRRLDAFYGVAHLRSAEEWSGLLREAGFAEPEVRDPSPFPENMWEVELRYPDMLQQVDEAAYQNPELWTVAQEYGEIMQRYGDRFGFALMTGTKMGSAEP